MKNQNKIGNKLWLIADSIRGKANIYDLKEPVLVLYFYKFLSEKLELHFSLYNENMELKVKENLGYYIKPKYQFKNLVFEAKSEGSVITVVQDAFKDIENSAFGEVKKVFTEIFSKVNIQSNLGLDLDEKNSLISKLLISLSEINFNLENGLDDTINGFEFLVDKFATSSGIRSSEFYTPKNVSKILAKIVTMDKKSIKSVYDPTCGTASLLLSTSRETDVKKFYGEELNQDIYRLALMNMIIHGVDFKNFDIQQGNSLEEPKHMNHKFEAIVANPPFSAKWSASKKFLDDVRFKEYGKLAPRSKADFAFIEHMMHHLDKNGTMAVILPHGVLYRGAIEGGIRKYIIEENYLDAVIGLPENIFYSTTIPTVILIFKKFREDNEDILFIDASKCYEQFRHYKKIIRNEDVNRIITAYKNRKDMKKFAHAASLDEIKENDYNLNIPRYIDTFEEKKPIDRAEIIEKLKDIDNEIKATNVKIKNVSKELGIKIPILGEGGE